MKKKIVALLLAMVCTLSLVMTGCGGDDDGKVKSNIEVSAPNEFPIVEEKVELTIFAPKSTFIEDFETNEFTTYFEELTNVKIKWEIASGDPQQALNLKLASGEYPDIFYDFSFTKEQQSLYAEQGVFQDISGYIEEHGYYIKDMFESRPDIKEDITIDGGIYGLPKVEESPYAIYPNAMWVYKPWLDKLGLEVPTTTDEFYNMLVAFRDHDPNGNGKKDEIPLATRGVAGNSGIELFLMNSFLSVGNDRISVIDDKVYFAANKDEYREGLRYIKKLYDEKLLYNDSFIIDRTQITSLGENDTPILGAGTGLWAGMFTINGAESGRIRDYVSIPPLKGPKGFSQSVEANTDFSSVKFVVTSACKYPEVAVKWIDWIYNEENRIIGHAKPGFRKANEGEIGIDGQQALWAQDPIPAGEAFGAIQNKGWTNFGVFYKPLETDLRTALNDEPSRVVAENRYEAYQQHGKVGKDVNFKPVSMSTDDATFVADYRTTINDLVDNAFAEFVTGVRSIDKDWDAYVKSLNDAGLKDYLKIMQKYVDKQ